MPAPFAYRKKQEEGKSDSDSEEEEVDDEDEDKETESSSGLEDIDDGEEGRTYLIFIQILLNFLFTKFISLSRNFPMLFSCA